MAVEGCLVRLFSVWEKPIKKNTYHLLIDLIFGTNAPILFTNEEKVYVKLNENTGVVHENVLKISGDTLNTRYWKKGL